MDPDRRKLEEKTEKMQETQGKVHEIVMINVESTIDLQSTTKHVSMTKL